MSEPSKNSSKFKVLVIIAVLAITLVWLLRIDPNPEIPYTSSDGKAMVLDLQNRLKSSEDMDATYLPIDIGAGSKIPEPRYTATIVYYERPKFPYIVRSLLKLFHLPVQGAHLNFDRGDFAIVSASNYRSGMLSTQQERRELHQVTAKNFPNQVFADGVIKESDALSSLEPNSHLKLHSDFLLVETKGLTRAYLLDQLPANTVPLTKRVSDFISNLPRGIK